MSQDRTVFGTEVTVETIKVAIVAIGDGYTVTAQVVLDQDDILFAVTIAQREATFKEASGSMVEEAIKATSAWLEANR